MLSKDLHILQYFWSFARLSSIILPELITRTDPNLFYVYVGEKAF